MDLGAQLDLIAHTVQAGAAWIAARPFYLLLVLMVFDIVTGLVLAAKEQRVSSKISREGMTRKLGFILAAAFALLLEPVGQTAVGTPAFGTGVTWMLCIPEAISVMENLAALGVPLPESWRRLLADSKSSRA